MLGRLKLIIEVSFNVEFDNITKPPVFCPDIWVTGENWRTNGTSTPRGIKGKITKYMISQRVSLVTNLR
jgi:hypothetical protein